MIIFNGNYHRYRQMQAFRERARFLIRAMLAEGVGVIATSHEAGFSIQTGERRLHLDRGAIVAVPNVPGDARGDAIRQDTSHGA